MVYYVPSLVYFDKFLTRWKGPIFKIRYSQNSQISVWKHNLFPRQAKPKVLSVLYFNYTANTPYRVWFNLDKSLARLKRPIFKIRYSRNSQISVWKTNLFPRQAIPKIFSVLCFSYTADTPYRVWFNLDKSLTRLKRPVFKIRYSQNSQIFVWKHNLFPKQAKPKVLSVLYSSYKANTPYRVWSNLDKSLTRLKRPIFKIRYSRNSQISVWKPNLFPRQAIPKILSVLCFSYTADTPYRVWFNLDKSLTRLKRPVFKIRYSRNSSIFENFPYEILNFF